MEIWNDTTLYRVVVEVMIVPPMVRVIAVIVLVLLKEQFTGNQGSEVNE